MRSLLTGAILLTACMVAMPWRAEAVPNAARERVVTAWQSFKARFMTSDGRVIDDVNGSVSHSEGQGYGLLAAMAADDRPAFDRILAWTEEHLFVREDDLAAWRWDPAARPEMQDMNNASDGDLLIAWALSRAAKRWSEPELRDRATAILDALGAETVVPSRFGKVMLPGAEGFGSQDRPDGPVVNLSYWIFPALAELDGLTPAFPAAEISATGEKILGAAAERKAGIAPDWTSLSGDGTAPAEGFPPESGYNAVRIPLHLAWADGTDKALLEPWVRAWRRKGKTQPAVFDLPEGKRTGSMADPNYAAVAMLLECASGGQPTAPRAFAPTHYYPSILYILTQMALAERYPQCS